MLNYTYFSSDDGFWLVNIKEEVSNTLGKRSCFICFLEVLTTIGVTFNSNVVKLAIMNIDLTQINLISSTSQDVTLAYITWKQNLNDKS